MPHFPCPIFHPPFSLLAELGARRVEARLDDEGRRADGGQQVLEEEAAPGGLAQTFWDGEGDGPDEWNEFRTLSQLFVLFCVVACHFM